MKTVAQIVFVTFLITFLLGCVSREDLVDARDTTATILNETRAALEETRQAEADARAKALELALELEQAQLDGDTKKAEALAAQIEGYKTFADGLGKQAEAADAVIVKAEGIVTALDAQIAEWDAGGAQLPILDTVGDTLLPFLPPQYQTPAVMAIAGLGLIGRLIQRSNALNSLSKSVVKLADNSPAVRDAISSNAATLNQIQTKTAKKAIDKAQAKSQLSVI